MSKHDPDPVEIVETLATEIVYALTGREEKGRNLPFQGSLSYSRGEDEWSEGNEDESAESGIYFNTRRKPWPRGSPVETRKPQHDSPDSMYSNAKRKRRQPESPVSKFNIDKQTADSELINPPSVRKLDGVWSMSEDSEKRSMEEKTDDRSRISVSRHSSKKGSGPHEDSRLDEASTER